ncbi:MAG TPA: hypothetical protein VHA74_01780, partial [Candidatus Dojkabacteria bacterium]|nr:hypothetical protein [Candidatus Dojkabacteria bacterium]
TVSFFAQGMFLYEDYMSLVAVLFSLLFETKDIDKVLMDFLLTHLIVDEETTIHKHSNGKFIADHWLELDFGSRKDPNWTAANEVLHTINTFCKKISLIPPLRPYAVVRKNIPVMELTKLSPNDKKTL